MPSGLPWFRVYNRAIYDPKIRALDDTDFRLLFTIWCLASESRDRGRVVGYDEFAIATLSGASGYDQWRGEGLPGDLRDSFFRLHHHGLITTDVDGVIEVVNWWELQYPEPADRPRARDAERKRLIRRPSAYETIPKQGKSSNTPQSVRNLSAACPPLEVEVEVEVEKELTPSSISVSTADVQTVYDHWRAARGKSNRRYDKLSDGRRAKIKSRLREFSAAELMRAIDAVALDPWEDRPRYDDLTVLFRSHEQVERFLGFAETSPTGSRNGNGSIEVIAGAEVDLSQYTRA